MRTVIIVDDEPITRMDLSDMMAEIGCRVVGEGSDGFDAIELCRAKHPDVVLMDVRMPIFDGLSASKTIVDEDLAGCVVLLTALSDAEIVRRAGEIGVSGYLTKPIDQKALLPALEVACAQSERLRESRRQTREMEERIKEDRKIHKAQAYLAKNQGCSEAEAYKLMRKAAMDKRVSISALADTILSQAAGTDDVAAVKAYLMETRHMKDARAYQYIASYGEAHGCSTEEAARRLKKNLMADS